MPPILNWSIMKEKIRWYKSKSGAVHSRKESWFTSDEHEKIYKDNYKRINGENDLTIYVAPNPKPKKKKSKLKSKGDK